MLNSFFTFSAEVDTYIRSPYNDKGHEIPDMPLMSYVFSRLREGLKIWPKDKAWIVSTKSSYLCGPILNTVHYRLRSRRRGKFCLEKWSPTRTKSQAPWPDSDSKRATLPTSWLTNWHNFSKCRFLFTWWEVLSEDATLPRKFVSTRSYNFYL